MPNAKLMAASPRPVAVFSGEMNSACDCRMPMVSAKTSAAQTTARRSWRVQPWTRDGFIGRFRG
jgi:hypothetical protein